MDGKGIRQIGGGCGTALGLVCVMIQSTHPAWFGNHAWILPVGYFWLAFAICLWLTQYKWFQKVLGIHHIASSDAETLTQKAGRDQSGNFQVASVHGDLIVHPKEDRPPQVPQRVSEEIPPNLQFLGLETVLDGNESFSNFGENYATLLKLQNKLPTLTLKSVVVSLTFTIGQEVSEHVSRGQWYCEHVNQIEIKINHMARVVLGTYHKDHWYYFENGQQFLSAYPRFSGDLEPDEEPVRRIDLRQGELTAEVEVFNHYKGQIYWKSKFLITRTDEYSCEVREIPQ